MRSPHILCEPHAHHRWRAPQARLAQRAQRAARADADFRQLVAGAAADAHDSHSGRRLPDQDLRTALEAGALAAHALDAARLRTLRLRAQLARAAAPGADGVGHTRQTLQCGIAEPCGICLRPCPRMITMAHVAGGL